MEWRTVRSDAPGGVSGDDAVQLLQGILWAAKIARGAKAPPTVGS